MLVCESGDMDEDDVVPIIGFNCNQKNTHFNIKSLTLFSFNENSTQVTKCFSYSFSLIYFHI